MTNLLLNTLVSEVRFVDFSEYIFKRYHHRTKLSKITTKRFFTKQINVLLTNIYYYNQKVCKL